MAKGTSAAPARGAIADRLIRKIESFFETAYCPDGSGTGWSGSGSAGSFATTLRPMSARSAARWASVARAARICSAVQAYL
jgi:hypothetical protein